MNMQPPSQNSAMFPAPDRMVSLLEARKGRYLRAIKRQWSRYSRTRSGQRLPGGMLTIE